MITAYEAVKSQFPFGFGGAGRTTKGKNGNSETEWSQFPFGFGGAGRFCGSAN
jgi:hypothetical protein